MMKIYDFFIRLSRLVAINNNIKKKIIAKMEDFLHIRAFPGGSINWGQLIGVN